MIPRHPVCYFESFREFDSFDLNVFFSTNGEGKDAKFVYENDVQKWEEFYKGMGILSKSRLKDYSKWFRKLTLKKVDRVTYVQQKIEKLRSLS